MQCRGGKLCGFLREPEAAKGLGPKVEMAWVSHLDTDDIERMLVKSIANTVGAFERLVAPTEPQRALKAEVDKINEGIKQAGK